MKNHPFGRRGQVPPVRGGLEVPGYGFAFPVRVSGQIYLFGFHAGFFDLGQQGLLVLHDHVGRLEILLHVYADLVLGQIAHVSLGRGHNILAAQYLANCPGFGRRFYYHQALADGTRQLNGCRPAFCCFGFGGLALGLGFSCGGFARRFGRRAVICCHIPPWFPLF